PDLMDYLRSLPFTHHENDYFYVHSTPLIPDQWQYIFSPVEAQLFFEETDYRFIFVGHSHVPIIFKEKGGVYRDLTNPIPLYKGRYIINVGSVGQPRDGDPRACFTIFDDEELTISYIRLSYPVQTTYLKILEAGLPLYLARRLMMGN
ncbi:MAG: metallophosphoesterase, partial [Methanobacteriota archaeon]